MARKDIPITLEGLPQEVILHILSYLDIPDLVTISRVSRYLSRFTNDPILHRNRIRVVAPSRVRHSLFGQSTTGIALRPTVPDLINRGVLRGLALERRWRMGVYIYGSVNLYENSVRVARNHTKRVLSSHLQRRSSASQQGTLLVPLHQSLVLPDIEFSSLRISRSLLPTIHKLKWSFQRDKLAKTARGGIIYGEVVRDPNSLIKWLEGRGRTVVQDGERVRLALCPDVRRKVGFFEQLKHTLSSNQS